jgi:hypothetical protein
MPENFSDAASRHWMDGVQLHSSNRVSNADQLFAFATECALKVALLQLPNCVENKRLTARYLEHVDVLWDRIPVQNLHRRFPTLVAVLKLENPFQNWNPGQRYEDDTAVTPAMLEQHREAAKRVLGAMGFSGVRQRG